MYLLSLATFQSSHSFIPSLPFFLWFIIPSFPPSFVSALPDDGEGELDEGAGELDDRGITDHADSDDDLLEEDEDEEEGRPRRNEQPLWVLPLYSLLPPEKQQLVSHGGVMV